MIVNVEKLPPSVQNPFLLSLRLEAMAMLAKNLGEARPTSNEIVLHEYAKLMKEAQDAGLTGDFKGTHTLTNNIQAFIIASRNLWGVGLLQLQKAIAEGSWVPEELDLSIKPGNEPILNYRIMDAGLANAKLA